MTLSLVSTTSVVFTSCGSDDSTTQNPNPTPPTPQPETKTLTITASAEDVFIGESVTLTATLDGQDVTSGTTFYVDEVAITGNTVTSDTPVGMLIKGKYPNANDSQYIQVNFVENPFEGIVGTGNFIFNGTANQLNGAFLRPINVYPDNEGGYTVWWIQYGWSGNNPDTAENFVAISFDTPAVVQNNELVSFELPDANQNMYYSIEAARVNGQNIITEQLVEGSGTITYNSLDMESDPQTSDFEIQVTGTHNVTFTYSGSILAGKGNKGSKGVNQFKNLEIRTHKQLLADKKALSRKLLNK